VPLSLCIVHSFINIVADVPSCFITPWINAVWRNGTRPDILASLDTLSRLRPSNCGRIPILSAEQSKSVSTVKYLVIAQCALTRLLTALTDFDYWKLFHDLLLRSYLYHCVWSVTTAHNVTPEKPDNNYSPHPLTPTWCLRNNIQLITGISPCCGHFTPGDSLLSRSLGPATRRTTPFRCKNNDKILAVIYLYCIQSN